MNYDRVVSHFLLQEGRQKPWDIVIEHDLLAGSYIPRLRAAHGTACIAFQHCSIWQASQPDAAPFNSLVMAWLRRNCLRAMRASNAVVCMNESYAEEVRRIIQPAPRIYVSPDGFPVGESKCQRVEPRIPKILFVGRLSPEKNIPLLIEAVAPLIQMDWEVEIIGSGSDRGRVLRCIQERRLEGRVRMAGELPNSEVYARMAAATMLVLPSKHESLGRVLLEAMNCGLPVVASAVGGLPYVLGFGQYGLLVPSNDAGALRSAIRLLLTQPSLRAALGEAGRQQVKAFSADAQQKLDNAIIAEILQTRGFVRED